MSPFVGPYSQYLVINVDVAIYGGPKRIVHMDTLRRVIPRRAILPQLGLNTRNPLE